MRIISKKQDYYDCIQNVGGFDKSIIYERKPKKIKYSIAEHIDEYLENQGLFKSHIFGSWDINTYIIGFCGQLYKVMKFKHLTTDQTYFVYNYDELISTIKKINNKELNDYFYKSQQNFMRKRRYLFSTFNEKGMRNFFDSKPLEKFNHIFIDYKTPVFVIKHPSRTRDVNLYTNPILKNYGFYKIKVAYEAFQDIEWYISGVLRLNEKETVDISDKDMLYKKGFNDKSFKKESTKNV